MTPLRKGMIEEMGLRDFARATVDACVDNVAKFAKHFGRSPELLEHVRQYLVHLVEERKLAWGTYNQARAALRYLYRWVLKRGDVVRDIRGLPHIPVPEPVAGPAGQRQPCATRVPRRPRARGGRQGRHCALGPRLRVRRSVCGLGWCPQSLKSSMHEDGWPADDAADQAYRLGDATDPTPTERRVLKPWVLLRPQFAPAFR
jgi:hypothetical protein